MLKGFDVYYYSKDGLGSVVNLTDSSGQVVESYTYDEYGNVSAPSQIGNRYLYTAREYDPEINLYYYRARYYSPTIGRFLQRDLAGYEGGINLYAYAKNNPINWKDPWGLDPEKKKREAKWWEWVEWAINFITYEIINPPGSQIPPPVPPTDPRYPGLDWPGPSDFIT